MQYQFAYKFIYTVMKTLNDYIIETSSDLQITNIDVNELIDMLKDAFCEEMNAWYQYYIISPFLSGPERVNIVTDYKENGNEELAHADKLLNRINELGGDFTNIDNPDTWNKLATHKFIVQKSDKVEDSIQVMIEAEKGAIETYTKLENFTRDSDIVTNQLVKGILADEQKHLQEMIEFANDIKNAY